MNLDSTLSALASGSPHALEQLVLPVPLRITVLAPHPDDFDAIAVTLRLFHARGDVIHLAVLTDGASGVEDDYTGGHHAASKADIREAEQLASCTTFGLPRECIKFLRLPEDEAGLIVDAHSMAALGDWLAPRQPQLVFMPHGNDSNITHQRTYALARTVAAQQGLALTALLNQDAKTRGMRHDLYTAFDAATAEWKAALLRQHDSQHQRNLNTRGHGFDERVLAVNRRTASVLGLGNEYAEAFELEHWPAG